MDHIGKCGIIVRSGRSSLHATAAGSMPAALLPLAFQLLPLLRPMHALREWLAHR